LERSVGLPGRHVDSLAATTSSLREGKKLNVERRGASMFTLRKYILSLVALLAMSLPASAAGGCVALTFDDGPDAVLTPRLLAILDQEHVKATFYLVGRRVAPNADIVRRIHAAGHEIGNHSWSHPRLTRLNNAAALQQVAMTDSAVTAAIGVQPETLRAPYGAINARVRGLFSRPFVAWDVDTLDWRYRNSTRIANVAVERARAGSIVLMHDIHATTIAAVPAIIDGLRSRGFDFVTVTQLKSAACGTQPIQGAVTRHRQHARHHQHHKTQPRLPSRQDAQRR